MKHHLFPFLVCALLLAACSKPTITARHDIEACGVDDPLVNLPWLADVCAFSIANNYNTEITLYLLTDTTAGVYYFHVYYPDRAKGPWPYNGSLKIIYNCEGDEVIRSVPGNGDDYQSFIYFTAKEDLGEIWRYQR